MNHNERAAHDKRYWSLERQIQDIHAGKVVDGGPAEIEGRLLEEQDEIEWLLLGSGQC